MREIETGIQISWNLLSMHFWSTGLSELVPILGFEFYQADIRNEYRVAIILRHPTHSQD